MWTIGPVDVGMGRRLVLADRDQAVGRGRRRSSAAHGRSSRPWNVDDDRASRDAREQDARPLEVAVDEVELAARGRGRRSSSGRSTPPSRRRSRPAGAPPGPSATRRPGTSESPVANVVTSWPRRSSSLDELEDDPLGAAIGLGGTRSMRRGDLGDAERAVHRGSSSGRRDRGPPKRAHGRVSRIMRPTERRRGRQRG